MITITLTERELEWLRWQIVRDRTFNNGPDECDLTVKAKILRACGEVAKGVVTPKANRVWDAIKAVSNG